MVLKRTTIAAGLITVLLAALFLASSADRVVAKENKNSLKGEVVAVDSYAGTLTVKAKDDPDPYAEATENGFSFAISPKTPVTICFQNKSPENIRVGEMVAVTYHEREGKLFADAIDIAPVILACYDQ